MPAPVRRRRGRTARVLTAVALLAGLLAGCTDGPVTVRGVAEPASVPPRDALLEPGGWPEAAAWIRRENADGRPVVVNILASWCVPCRRELPMLIEAAAELPEVAFLGIDHLDQRQAAERFVEEMGITFPTLYDIDGDVAFAIAARGMPTTVVFDTRGRLVAHRTGEISRPTLDTMLAELG